MLYVGCSSCRSIAPLWCAGQMLHTPVLAQASPYGPWCGFCGPMAPYFTCSQCGAMQWMYLAGTPPPQALPQGQLVAPVVQAPQGAGTGEVKGLLMQFAGAFVKSAGEGMGQQMAGWAA